MENKRKNENSDMSKYKAPVDLALRQEYVATTEYRTDFMRDRDRILYSKSFRRLAGKTQVYLSGLDDHQRTRLTHTLEVSQIARTIAIALDLDTDLVEAIALGHDLGHTPFGHVGERTLHEIMTPQTHHALGEECPLYLSKWEEERKVREERDKILKEYKAYLGFKHNLQSLVCAIKHEKNYGGNGLNLTNFTLFGMQAHSSATYKGLNENKDMLGYYDKYFESACKLPGGGFAWSLESLVVAEADEIAQRHHDVEDAIRGHLVSKTEIKKIINELFSSYISEEDKKQLCDAIILDDESFIAIISRIIVNMFVTRLIVASKKSIEEFVIRNNKSIRDCIKEINYDDLLNRKIITYRGDDGSDDFDKQAKKFKNTICDRLLSSYDIQTADAKGKYIIRKLFQAFYATPQQLPDYCVYEFLMEYEPEKYTKEKLYEIVNESGIGKIRSDFVKVVNKTSEDNGIKKLLLMRIICDYIAGMTDSFAQKTYEELYG